MAHEIDHDAPEQLDRSTESPPIESPLTEARSTLDRPTEGDIKTYFELMKVIAAPDGREEREIRESGGGPSLRWLAWSWWAGLFVVLVMIALGAGLLLRGGDDDTADQRVQPVQPAGRAPDAAPQEQSVPALPTPDVESSAVASDVPATVEFTGGNGAVQLMVVESVSAIYNASSASPDGISAVVDPVAKTLTGTIDLSLAMTPDMQDAPDEYANATLDASFVLPLTTTPPPGGPAASVPSDGTGVWWFGGEVPIALTMDGQDAVSISRWDDGREEVVYEQATESTTVTAWLGGSLREPDANGRWAVSIEIDYSSPVDLQPFWRVMLWAGGTVAAPGLATQ